MRLIKDQKKLSRAAPRVDDQIILQESLELETQVSVVCDEWCTDGTAVADDISPYDGGFTDCFLLLGVVVVMYIIE